MSTQIKRSLSPLARLVLCAAFIAGLAARGYFISSHGSWDTEYRKAWANEVVTAGITNAYGPPGSVPEGEFLAQLSGQAPRFEVPFRGRTYVIDYPPLALAIWGESWSFFTSRPRPYRGAEAENVAVKFPPVLGDLLGVVVLLWAFRGAPATALALGALYWLFPVTWVSSAAHGNFDGLVPPFLLASIFAAPVSPFAAGALFAVSCLIKPTAALALPVVFMVSGRAGAPRVVAGGAIVTVLVFLPYALAGTLDAAFIHIVRLFSQERISGGYANPWWVFGHVHSVLHGQAEWTDPVDYIRRDAVSWPLGLIGFMAMGLAAAWILHCARAVRTPRAAAYVGALLLLSWGALTIGAHDNHNHPLFLLLVGTGLGSGFLRGLSAAAATSTLIGATCLHGLGRFYGPQWKAVLPVSDGLVRMRMAPGFDLTLILSVVNTAVLVFALARLKRTIAELEGN